MTEKELEKLFKSKLDNRQFEFNPANWEAMETILDSDPKPAGAFYWRSVMAVLLFGVAVWSFITFTPAAENNVVNTTEQIISPLPSSHRVEDAVNANEEVVNQSKREEPQAISTQTDVIPVQEERPSEIQPSSKGAPGIATSKQPLDEAETVEVDNGNDAVVDEAALIETSPTIPITTKGFVFNTDLSSSLVDVSAPAENFTPEAFRKFDTRSSFYLEAAPIFSGSYNANDVGVGWKVGLGWERAVGEKFQFNIGLGYSVQNGVGIENNSDSVFYNFGKEVVETQVTNKRLDYIELPVSIGYKLNEKNMIQVGMYVGYLVNVSREVDKEISRFKSETQYESVKESGYQKDFKRMDCGLELGYRYRLTPALSVGLHYNLGLVDITKNTQGDYLLRHTNQNTRVVFRYRFL